MSVAEEVEKYVENHPYIQKALADEIVNYSALARKTQEEIDGSIEAIKMALRRQSKDLKQERKRQRRNIGKVMNGTSIELKNNLQICKTDKQKEAEISAKTKNGYTLIQESEKECEGEIIEEQVMLTLKSPKNLEKTPGVLAYILSILAAHEINITELISCREDTHIVINEEDATKTFKLLNKKLS